MGCSAYRDKFYPGITWNFYISGEGMNFLRKTLNSSERSQPLRDPRQDTFIMLIRFWLLSKKPFIPLFFTDSIKLDRIPTKIKLKTQACFIMYSTFWVGTSVNMQLPIVLFFVLDQLLYQQISVLYNFLELHWALSEKYFCHKFFFFNGFIQTSHPFNSQTLLSHKTFLANFP